LVLCVFVVVVVPVVLVIPPIVVVPVVPDVFVAVVPDVVVAVVSVASVPLVSVDVPAGIADVDVVPEVLDIAEPVVSDEVDIVEDVSLAAVSVTLVFSVFLHAPRNSARATTMRIASVFFIRFFSPQNLSTPRRFEAYSS